MEKTSNVPNHQPAYICEVCVCRYLGIDRDRQTDRQTDKQIDTYTFVIGYKDKNWVAATKKNGDLDQSLIQKKLEFTTNKWLWRRRG